MSLKSNTSIYTEDTLQFSDSPTMASITGKDGDFSLFSALTEVQQDSLSAQDENEKIPLTPGAPVNDRYVITHEIGAGGYGVVWYGVQTKLKRRVALKTLKVKTNHFEQMARLFRQEALTTAYLQHPHVVPVYDLTEDKNGGPMVAMKLVEGRLWNRVLAEDFNSLSPLEFLERHIPVLIDVVQAVAFAHSKGIIHRDLKPSQVMIGNYGEVLLMDWGLAMAPRDADNQIFCDPAIIVDAQSPLIKPLAPAGTPGYMAPEQTEKDTSKLGPWTDVYLMGAVLYELLTGYRPHSGSRKDDPFAEARENVLVKPEVCTPDRDIPSQLSALALKAMSTKPSQRVSSASAFASELRDYLQWAGRRGESMSLVTEVANAVITDEHTYENLQRFMDRLDKALTHWPDNQMAVYLRHQVLVTFARTALTNHDLKFARLLTDRIHDCHERNHIINDIAMAEDDFSKQEGRLKKATHLAQSEKDRAEALVRFLLLDLQKDLKSAGRPDLVYKVAKEALQFFDSLKDEKLSVPTLHNRCIAYKLIGTVLGEHGRRAEAESAYNRALELVETIMKVEKSPQVWHFLQAECLSLLGRLHFSMGRLDVATKEHYQALSLRQKNKIDSTSTAGWLRGVAQSHNDLAVIYWREQNLPKAMEYINESVTTTRRFHNINPADPDAQNDLATSLMVLSNIYRDMGEGDKALSVAYEALAIRIALSDQFPNASSRTEDVCWVRSGVGLLQLFSGELEAALENLKQDLSVRRRIYEEEPESVTRSFGLTFQLSCLAEVNFLLGRIDETERLLSECIVHSRKLAETDDSNPTAISRHAYHLVQMAELLATRGQWKEAERMINVAVDRAQYGYWLSANNSLVFRPLVLALALAARIARRKGDLSAAAKFLGDAEEHFQQTPGHRSEGEHESLIARLRLETLSEDNAKVLLGKLKSLRRLDPYILEWARQLGLKK